MNDAVINFTPRVPLDTGGGKKPLPTIENLEKILKAYGIEVRYNKISKDIEVIIPGRELPVENKFDTATALIISRTQEHAMPCTHVPKYLLAIAHKNQINPVATWIESRDWDGISRLDEFYATIESENEPLKCILIQRWMISAIAAAYRPLGVSAGGVLVFQGEQYLGKTNWFKNIVPKPQQEFIKDGLFIDHKNKDTLISCFSRWMVELGEIPSTFRKSDLDALKAFITSDMDLVRVPYDKAFSTLPRSTVFFGSVNDRKFLSDPTGNRRFWTIACTKINHTHGMDMQQVWAEIKVLYDTGEPWHLTREELEQLNSMNEEHELVDPLKEKLVTYYDWERPATNYKTATQVLEELGYKNIGKGEATRCGTLVLKMNGGLKERGVKGRTVALPPMRI